MHLPGTSKTAGPGEAQSEAATPPRTENDRVWRALYRRQSKRIQTLACREYIEGSRRLGLPAERVPTLEELNSRITPRSGWRTVRTIVRYTDAVPWYKRFARREFLVTDYMRGWDELDFTPEPDMFHDIFGHLPFFTLRRYARLQEMFAPAFLRAGDAQREDIKRLAWFSTEFGLVREDGALKAFGAGLMSGGAELRNVMRGKVRIEPFEIERVLRHDKAVWSQNRVLFEFPSLAALRRELARYFDAI